MPDIAAWKVSLTTPTPALETIRLSPTTATLDEISNLLPNGAYTTLRTYHKRLVPMLASHFNRLEESACLEGFSSLRVHREALRQSLRLALRNFNHEDVRIRLTLDLQKKPGDVYISIEKLHVPSDQDYLTGVKTVTRMMQRTNPKAKLTEFISSANSARQDIQIGINEVLMVDPSGFILEGLSSNFFAVLEGDLWTAEQNVLSGITRSMVLEAASKTGITIHAEAVHLNQFPAIREAFITSTSRGILPICSIDGKPVGEGKPGPITRKINPFFQQILHDTLEEI